MCNSANTPWLIYNNNNYFLFFIFFFKYGFRWPLFIQYTLSCYSLIQPASPYYTIFQIKFLLSMSIFIATNWRRPFNRAANSNQACFLFRFSHSFFPDSLPSSPSFFASRSRHLSSSRPVSSTRVCRPVFLNTCV